MSLYNLNNFDEVKIKEIINRAIQFKNNKNLISYDFNKTIALLFFESSTRTHYSFDVACKNLNINVVDFKADTSSLNKGESFIDTVKTFESFNVDGLVIRHSKEDYYKQLNLNIPVINGGDGAGAHPTQSLLDLMTIYENFGHFKGLKVAIVGDIKHSRVANTNYKIMKKLNMDVVFVADESFKSNYGNYKDLDEVLPTLDVIMLLRVQLERHNTKYSIDEYNKKYGLNKDRLKILNKKAIIMHPAPFNLGVELTKDVLEDNRCKIFKQSENGVYIRMAVIEDALK